MTNKNEDTSVIYFTKDDGTKYVSRHPADPQHSLHGYYRLGGFLLVIVILLILGVIVSITSPIITEIGTQATLQMLNDPQFADLMPAGTIEQLENSINLFHNPLIIVFYVLSVALSVALVVVIFLRKNLYLQLNIASMIISLANCIVTAFALHQGLFDVVLNIVLSLILGLVFLIYFLTSKRVKIYFKATREERQVV